MPSTISSSVWARLYELADAVKKLAPWEYMWEHEVFVVEEPESGKLGLVSVMGGNGEHFALGVYTGQAGITGFLALQEDDPSHEPMSIMEIPQVQLSFEGREMVKPEDRKVIRELGLRFRGRNAWPLFRHIRPGFIPWFLDEEDVPVLTAGLEQLLEIAVRSKEQPGLLVPDEVSGFLLRAFDRKESAWIDQRYRPSPPLVELKVLEEFEELIDGLCDLPTVTNRVEIDLFPLMTPLQDDEDEPPYFPYSLMFVDGETGYVIAQDLLTPLPSLEILRDITPLVILKKFIELDVFPDTFYVRSGWLSQRLKPYLARFEDVEIEECAALPALDEAKYDLINHMRGV